MRRPSEVALVLAEIPYPQIDPVIFRVGGFALGAGDEIQHLLGAAGDQRHLDDRQRDRGLEARLALARDQEGEEVE